MPVTRKELRENVDPRTLNFDPANPRKMAANNRARLNAGLEEFGLVATLTARGETGAVLGGNQRLEWAIAAGKPVDVTYVYGLTDEEAITLGILLNNPNAQGEWDFSVLGPLLSSLDANGFDATRTGFDESQLQRMIDYQRGGSGSTAVPEPRQEPAPRAERGEGGGETPGLGAGAAGGQSREQYGVYVFCNDEQHRQETYEQLQELGYQARIVVT